MAQLLAQPYPSPVISGRGSAARELGVSVIAEGVEDVEQLAELQRAGCSYAQGFLFADARPPAQTPLTAFSQIIRSSGR